MVLESILNPMQAEKKPWEMFFIGALYSSIAILLGTMIFGEDASLIAVFLTVLACVPIMYNTIKAEENKDMTINSEKKLLKEHGKALTFFVFLFFGIAIAFALWYIFLPPGMTENVFSTQTRTIASINSGATGNFHNPTKAFVNIFMNNFQVMIFCLLFAFLYGVGAIFILVWNASVLGAAIGNLAKTQIAAAAAATGSASLAAHFQAISLGILRYSIHGSFEILAYFIAGLAGGIISIAIIRHDFATEKFKKVVMDSFNLIMLALGVLVVAGLIEVYVTPLFF